MTKQNTSKDNKRLLDQTVILNGHKIPIVDLPEQTIVINNYKILIGGLSERSAIISAQAIREEQNFTAADDILDNFGLSCNANDKECLEEQWKMLTIKDQFHIHENSWFTIEWATSIFFVGSFCGGVLLSPLSDIIGGRAVVFPSILLLNLFGILTTYAQNYTTFLLIRFFEGCFFTSSSFVVWTFAAECVSVRKHPRVLSLFGCFWVLGYCSIAFIAKLVPDWRDATRIICLPSALLAVILWIIMPDSFHFLAEHSRARSLKTWLHRADKNLYEVALLNRLLNDKPIKRSFNRLFNFLSNNPTYIRYVVVSSLIWIINFVTYFGVSFYSTQLSGNAFENYALSGLVELPVFVVAPFLLDKFGRKRSYVFASFLNTCCFGVLTFINQSNRSFFVPVYLLAKCSSSSVFNFMFAYHVEIFPTIARRFAVGVCAVCSSLGAVIGTHVYYAAQFHSSIPWLIFGLLAAVSGFLCALGLPETKTSKHNKPLVVITSFKS